MKLKALQCPQCGDMVEVKDEQQKFLFCSRCGSKLIFDDEVQRFEHKVSGTVRVEGLDKVNEIAQHIGSAGGGSMLAKAQSMAKSAFMSLFDYDDDIDQKFKKALAIYSDCTLALAGLVLIIPDSQIYAKRLQKLAPDITQDELNIIDELDAEDIFFCAYAESGLISRCEYFIEKHKQAGDITTFINFVSKGKKSYQRFNGKCPVDLKINVEIFELLIKNGAKITALMLSSAIIAGNTDKAELLIKHCTDLNNIFDRQEILETALSQYTNKTYRDNRPQLFEGISLLIKYGANASNISRQHISDMAFCYAKNDINEMKKVLELFLQNGFDFNLIDCLHKTPHYLPFIDNWHNIGLEKYATESGVLAGVDFILEHGARVWEPFSTNDKKLNKKMPQGITGLTFAIDHSMDKIIEKIYKYISYDDAQRHMLYAKRFCKNSDTKKLVVMLSKQKKK